MNEKLILSAVQKAYHLFITLDSMAQNDISMFIFYLNLELKAIHPLYLEDLHTIVALQMDSLKLKLKNKSIHSLASQHHTETKLASHFSPEMGSEAKLALPLGELEKDKFLAELAYCISQKKPIAFTKKGSDDNFGPSIGLPMSRSVPETNHNNTWFIIISFFAVVIVLYLITVWN